MNYLDAWLEMVVVARPLLASNLSWKRRPWEEQAVNFFDAWLEMVVVARPVLASNFSRERRPWEEQAVDFLDAWLETVVAARPVLASNFSWKRRPWEEQAVDFSYAFLEMVVAARLVMVSIWTCVERAERRAEQVSEVLHLPVIPRGVLEGWRVPRGAPFGCRAILLVGPLARLCPSFSVECRASLPRCRNPLPAGP